MEFEQIIKLIETVSSSKLDKFEYKSEGVNLRLEKKPEGRGASSSHTGVSNTAAPGGSANTAAIHADAAEEKAEGSIIASPLVGTFYVAGSEEAKPFVSIGDTVKKGQVVAIVEAMKLMNEIESDFDGTVLEVLAENGSAVEYGQPLFRIKKD